MPGGHYKDEILDGLARRGNVAQFVSFGPDLEQRFAWIHGRAPNEAFDSLEEAARAILEGSPERSVNIRSFEPLKPKSRAFVYGQQDLGTILGKVRELAGEGLFTILNETVDIHDGGVSGVAYGDVVEFAPEDTPRCVEKPGTASWPREMVRELFERIYGFALELPVGPELRVEFSLHPLRRGYRHEHVIIWEIEDVGPAPGPPEISWPNRFSRFMGDKAYGLLMADALGLPVPRTLVVPRRLAPFSFGTDTGVAEVWLRTCPTEQMPGLFTTRHGWIDPYELMRREDPEGTAIASILSQQGVEAEYSGALVARPDGAPLVEGIAGFGDEFMGGRKAPEELPDEVESAVLATYETAAARLGPVRLEWVFDGRRVWVVQLHKGAGTATGRDIYPGEAETFHRYEVGEGIEGLRELIGEVEGSGEGIVLVGHVGVTSHFGDLLRRAKIPSRIEAPA